jgi:hypothetical protein
MFKYGRAACILLLAFVFGLGGLEFVLSTYVD